MPDMHHQMTAANKVCLAQLPLPKVAQIFIQALTTQLLLQRNGGLSDASLHACFMAMLLASSVHWQPRVHNTFVFSKLA